MLSYTTVLWAVEIMQDPSYLVLKFKWLLKKCGY